MNAAHARIEWQSLAGFSFLPAADPLWRSTPLPLVSRYNVLGVALAVRTNAPLLAELAASAFGRWGPPADDAAALELALILHDAPAAPGPRPAPIFRVIDDYFLLAVGGSLGFADRHAGRAAALITPTLLHDPAYVQVNIVECLGLYLTTRARRAVLHAAALVHGGNCVLVTGPQGAGKSTLAYACVRAGFSLLAEDVVYIDDEAEVLRAWGNPWALHLLPDALRFFPELAHLPVTEQLNGEHKLRVDVAALRPDAAVTQARVSGVLSLGRTNDLGSRVTAADPKYVAACLNAFEHQLGPEAWSDAGRVVARLLAGRVAHLEAGSDLVQAARALQAWLEAGPG